MQLQNVEKERHMFSLQMKDMQTEIAVLKERSVNDDEILKKRTKNEEKLLQINSDLQSQLIESNTRVKEFEEELLALRSQCLDTVIDSQVSTSEIRSDVEQARKRIANENGAQKAERLRAHQDMVNRMIQIGEKSRENDLNVKKLQADDKKLVAEIMAQIQKLGDQEQQELIHGTLKALELENQVLNMRNAQLEREVLKDSGSRANEKLNNTAENSEQGRSIDADDTDTTSFQSEQSDFTILSQKFEYQITHLQNQLEEYKRDLNLQKNYQMELSQEKEKLMDQVEVLSNQLKEKQETVSTPCPKETSMQTEKENYQIETRLLEVEGDLQKSKLSMQQMQVEKQCLGQELEAMARVVQDLETKVAAGEEERQALITNMEELDQQHQDALDKLLQLRKADQVENEELKSQVLELKLTVTRKSCDESAVQTENVQCSDVDALTQTENIGFDDKGNQATVMVVDEGTSTNHIDGKIHELQVDPLIKYDLELCEKIKKSVNFDIPNDFNKTHPHSFYLVKEIVKIANDNKWKKDTLERKVSELIRENKDAKSTIEILEAECSNLKDNIERLAEQLVGVAKSGKDPLPTILENCEEMEVLELKNANLEAEVDVLRETRINLEQDAARMRDDRQELLARIRNLEAHVRNQDNLQREVEQMNNASMESTEAALAAAESNRISFEVKAQSLAQELESLAEKYETDVRRLQEARKQVELKCDELVQKELHKEQEVQEMKNIVKGLEDEKTSLLRELQEKCQKLEETSFKLRENSQERQILDLKIAELQKHFEEEKELREKLCKASGDLELSAKMKLDLENQLHALAQKLQNAELQVTRKEELEVELKKWKNEASSQEQKVTSSLESINKLKQENEVLKEQISESKEEVFVNQNKISENFVQEIEELNGRIKMMSKNEESLKEMTEDLKQNINTISNEKFLLEQNLSYLTNQVKSLNEEIIKCKLESSEKEQSVVHYEEMVSQLKGEMSSLELMFQEKYQNDILELRKKSNEELLKLKSEISVFEDNKNAHLKKIDTLSSELSSIKSINEGLMEENNKISVSIKESEEKMLALPQLHERISLLNNEILELKSKLKRQESSVCVKEEKAIQSEKLIEENGDPEFRRLIEEKQELILSLNGKTQEVGTVQVQLQQLKLTAEREKENVKLIEKEKDFIFNEKSQVEEKLLMTKETVSKLSEMIKEKDSEIETMKSQLAGLSTVTQESENLRTQFQQAQLSVIQVVKERDQLLQTVHVKHQESVQYHNEIQRLSQILSQEMTKYQQLSIQYAALVKKSEEQFNNHSPAHQDELKTLQDLVKVKEEGIHQLSSRLELQDQELRARGMELEMLRHQIESMAMDRAQNKDRCSSAELDELQEKYNNLTHTLKEEQRKNKQVQNEFELCQGREISLQRELERLRVHLVEIEDTYTQEALKTEEQIRELQNKLQQAEEMITSSSTVYKSANIRANQQVETLQEQARLIAQQRDDVQGKLSAAEDQVAKHAAALRNLQTVLEQFQRDKEREIESAKASVYMKVEAAQQRHHELLGEISSLKSQLREAKEGLSAASRLGQELERKTEMVLVLKQEVAQLMEKLKKSEEAAQTINENAETKVDKSLVKNVVLGYFLAPANSKFQVLQVVSSVLDFSEDEKNRVQKKLGLHGSEAGGGILKSLLHPGGSTSPSQQSLSEAFVRFLENESIPQAKLKMLPDTSSPVPGNSSRPTTPRSNTPVNSQNKTPLLLTDVQLPTFAQLPVGRNSSSLLKDILRES